LNRLKWPFQKEEIQADIETLRQYRDIFDTSMAIDNLVLTAATYNIVRDAERRLASLTSRDEREELGVIKSSLSPIDFDEQHAAIFSLYVKGTGQWILDSEKFRQWCSGQGETLWCPGVRKSTARTFQLCGIYVLTSGLSPSWCW
jgi:hypothetical protein